MLGAKVVYAKCDDLVSLRRFGLTGSFNIIGHELRNLASPIVHGHSRGAKLRQ